MATIMWVGGSSTDGAVAANWIDVSSGATGLPGASDTIVFDGNATQNCTFSSSAISQVVQIQIKEDFEHQIVFATSSHAISLQSMIIEKTGAISASTATTFAFSHSSFPFTSGGLATYVSFIMGAPELGEPDFTNGVFVDSTSRNNVTYTFANPASSVMVLDDGVYPHVTITAQSGTAYFKLGYGTPGTTYGKVDMLNFNVSSAVEIREGTGAYYPTANDKLKKFKFGGTLTIASNYFYAYKSQVEFLGASGSGLVFPAEGQTATYGSGTAFNTQFHDIILSVNTAGHTVYLAEGRTLSCNYLEVGPAAKFIGPAQHPGAEIRSIKRPGIFGTWNFSQVADGIYSSNDSRPFMGVPQGGTGLITHTKDLLLFGNDQNALASDANLKFDATNSILWVDKGLKITDHSTHPLTPATGFGQIWIRSSDNKLIYTDESGTDTDLGASGGGGITALTGDVTASGSGSVAATIAAGAVEHGMLNDNIISGQNAVTSIAQADLIMVDDGPGEVKKATFSNFEDSIFGNVSGDATIAAGGALTIGTGVVEHAMLDTDCVDGDNIADDSINSEHYVDGSIDTAHIADNQVTVGKLADLSRGSIIYGNASAATAELTKGSAGNVLTSDGTDIAWAAPATAGTVTSIATTSPITGGTITGSGTIGISTGISNGNVLVANANVADNDFLKVDGTSIEGRTAAEVKADLDLEGPDIVTASYGAPLVAVTLGTTVSGFTSGSYTIAPLANVVVDNTSGWDTSNHWFVIPATGYYEIQYSASMQALTTLSHIAITRIYKDTGSGFNTVIGSGSTSRESGAISAGHQTVLLQQNDKVALYVYHNGGSGKNLIGDNIVANYTMISIRMVGA